MPACDARYDATLSDGRLQYGVVQAVLDFEEERVPDDWGDPGALIDARLVRYTSQPFKSLAYVRCGRDQRKRLFIQNAPAHAYAKACRYLRWQVPESDPPPHDDPDWIVPP